MILDSYINYGVSAAVALVNGLTDGFERGRPIAAIEPGPSVKAVLAVDPPSLAQYADRDAPAFMALAGALRPVFGDLDRGDVRSAAARLNALLARHPASPHLAEENGVWRLHHHPKDAPLLPMWTSICAEALARTIGEGGARRLGVCAAARCDRVFADTTKNASRRFCSVACQNRTKTAEFRRRKRPGAE